MRITTRNWIGMCLATIVAMPLWITPGEARAADQMVDMTVEEALAYQGRESVRDMPYHLAGAKHGKVEKDLGQMRTNKRTTAFGKTPQHACAIAFQSGIIQLQKRAQELGGNAVVDIESRVDGLKADVENGFRCKAGRMTVVVVLTARAVKLAD